MQIALRKIGNSTGLILPKAVLAALGAEAGSNFELAVENGTLIGKPVRKVREGWEEDAARVAAEDDPELEDWLAFDDTPDDELQW